jgi:flagellar biosynthesis GTPase FlhF
MNEALNAEAVLASIIELRASIAESRKELAEQGAREKEQRESSQKELAEQRAREDERWKRNEKEMAEFRANIAEQRAREDERWKRNEKEMAEFRANIAEQGAELRASIAEQGKRIDELCKKMDMTNSKLDENTRTVGLLTNKLGGIVENIMVPDIVKKFNEKGFKFDSVSANVEFLNEKKDGNLAEVDALLENGKFVIAVETKTDLSVRDVNAHIKRMQILRKNISRFKGKKMYGAFSTAISKKRPINYALEQGFYVLQQPDVMKVQIMDFPKNCSAKAW